MYIKDKDMNKKDKYFGDSRYEKLWEKMQLLQIEDVSTPRQDKNGTIVWKLPIKNQWHNARSIEVASFKTGYVRNNNSGYSNYQLNKRCEGEPEYFKLDNGDYRQFTTRGCVLIPIEIDRLEYLISYCLKNYYIKHANFVANGNYVAKWEHEWELEKLQKKYDNLADAARLDYEKTYYSPREVMVTIDGHRYKVQ
jgi:hypothetical protein